MLSIEDLKRMEDARGQGQSQEPLEQSLPIESANLRRSPISDIFSINDSVFVNSVIFFDNLSTSAHPTTCQTHQLTIGQTQTPKSLVLTIL